MISLLLAKGDSPVFQPAIRPIPQHTKERASKGQLKGQHRVTKKVLSATTFPVQGGQDEHGELFEKCA